MLKLVTNTALTTVENKIPNISSLVKKTDYNAKITDHDHDKYITTLGFNNLAARVFTARLAQANIVMQTDVEKSQSKNSSKTKIQINQNIYLLKMNLKNYKYLIQFILEVKVILKKMVHKSF